MTKKLVDQLRSLTTKQKIVFGLLLISNVLGSIEIFSESGVIVGVITLVFILALFTILVDMYVYIHHHDEKSSRRLKVYKAIVLYYFSTYIMSAGISLLFLSRLFLDQNMLINGRDYTIDCRDSGCEAIVNISYYQYLEQISNGWFSQVFILLGFAISIPFIYKLAKHLKIERAKLAAVLIPITLGIASLLIS